MKEVIRLWDIRQHRAVDEPLIRYHRRMLIAYENFINRLTWELIEKNGYSEDELRDMLDMVIED